MRSPQTGSVPGSFHLSFLLPKGVSPKPAVDADFAAADCKIRIASPLVKILGPSRERVFECASALLRFACEGRGRLSIAATLQSPAPGSGVDSWSIIVGADIAFSPTAIDPYFPNPSVPWGRDAAPTLVG